MNSEVRGVDRIEGIGVEERGAPGSSRRFRNGIRVGGVLLLMTLLWCVGSVGAASVPGLEPGDLRPGSLTILEDPEGLALGPDGTLYVVLRSASETAGATSRLIRFLPDGTRDPGYAANLPGALRDRRPVLPHRFYRVQVRP